MGLARISIQNSCLPYQSQLGTQIDCSPTSDLGKIPDQVVCPKDILVHEPYPTSLRVGIGRGNLPGSHE